MLSHPITYKQFIITILIIIIILFSISLYNIYKNKYANANENTNENENTYANIEQFESILNKLKNPSKKSSLNTSILKKNSNKLKNNKSVTFDELIKDAEDIDPSKYSVTNIKNSFVTYLNSFSKDKDKFKNVSGTTTESLEKFGYFKDKFFDIFI